VRLLPLAARRCQGLSISEKKERTIMNTEERIEQLDATPDESTAAIRAAATAVVKSIDGGVDLELREKLDWLRETLAKARRNGMSEERIQGLLDCVRASIPDVTETWSEILEQVAVFVWLEDPDGHRVRGDTAVVDRLIWEEVDVTEALEATIQALHDDLEPNWEIVVPGKVGQRT
jgi:hypothetical protein